MMIGDDDDDDDILRFFQISLLAFLFIQEAKQIKQIEANFAFCIISEVDFSKEEKKKRALNAFGSFKSIHWNSKQMKLNNF